MSKQSVWQSLKPSEQREEWYVVFEALMSFDRPDLTEAINFVIRDGSWPEDFRYGLEGLQAYRSFYRTRMDRYSPDQRAKIEAYDEEWTMDLIDQLHRHQFGVSADPTKIIAV